MRILCVQTNTYPFLHPLPIGPAMVARRLQRDGHEVRFVDLMGEQNPPAAAARAAGEFRPDLACFSIRNRDNQSPLHYLDPMPGIRDVVEAVRGAATCPSLLGGTAFTTFPSRILRYMGADYGIAGDDLEPVSRFVESLEAGSPDTATPGLVYRDSSGQVVLNPFRLVGYRDNVFDYHDLIDPSRYRKAFWQAAVITRTGCPERCSYCDTFHTFGRQFILREPGEIAEEMLALKRSGKVRAVWLVDAGFNRPLDHAKGVLREIIRKGAQLQLNGVFDPGEADREFFQLFRRAGGMSVMLFAESLSDPVLEGNMKSFTFAEVSRDARTMRDEGVDFMSMPTLGGPGETRDTVKETISRIPSLGALYTEISIGLRIQPRTALRERAVAEGLISADDDCWEPHFYISPDTPRDWLEQQVAAYKRRHPLRWTPMIPFVARAMLRHPWKWGPGEVVH